MATRQATSLGKPKPKGGAGDGNFTFRMPTQEQMDEQRGGAKKIPGEKWYQMKVTNVVFDPSSKSSGNPMWVWDLIIMAGEYAGKPFKMWTALTDAAAWKVQEVLEALGQECPPGEEITLDRKAVIGAACEGYVVDDDNNDEYSKLDKIRAHPKGAGYKPGKLKVEEEPWDEGGEGGEGGDGDETETEVERPRRPAPKPKAPAGRGRAPVSLGKGRRY